MLRFNFCADLNSKKRLAAGFYYGNLGLNEWLGKSLAESILEASLDIPEMFHATSSGGLPTDGLLAPVVVAEFGRGVAALGAGLLLEVVGTVVAATAQSVGLCVALTK